MFDLDGVIVDSEPFSTKASVYALKQLGVNPKLVLDDFFLGTSYVCFVNHINKKYGLGILPEVYNRLKLKEYFRIAKGKLKPFPGVKELIKQLERSKLKLAIASSSTREKLEFTLREVGLFGRFGVVVCAEDVHHAKPHPELYLKAAKALRLKPRECLAIEDTSQGIRSAKSAGMVCLAVTNTEPSHKLKAADLVVATLEGLSVTRLRQLFV